jgi:cardiolipin synthase A/B
VEGNHVVYSRAGLAAFERQLESIERARFRVWLEMYWFSGDALGARFFEALSRAAARGLEVRVVYDALGSYGTEQHWFDGLVRAGGWVAEFNPLRPLERRFHLSKITLRNHRKVLLIDDAVVFTGGTNLASEWLEAAAGGQSWRDDLVEVTGPIVAALASAFAVSWQEATGQRLNAEIAPQASCGTMRVSMLTQGTFPRRRQAQNAYIWRISAATRFVYLSHAYFVPEGRIARALAAAARRGVDVRILCPGRSDVPIVSLASRHTWDRLLNSGVRIFEWNESVLHSKSAVIDGEWVTVGSLNLDRISLRNNRELNISVLDSDFAAVVERQFLLDTERSTEVSCREFKTRSWAQRAIETLSYELRRWL